MTTPAKTPSWSKGEFYIWLTGAALAISLFMVAALLFIVVYFGLGFFWPSSVHVFQMKEGRVIQGEIADREVRPSLEDGSVKKRYRLKIKQGNRDIYGSDFIWINEDAIEAKSKPGNIVVLERLEWGNFYGALEELRTDKGETLQGAAAWKAFREEHPKIREIYKRIKEIEKDDIGKINYYMEKNRLQIKGLEGEPSPDAEDLAELQQELSVLQSEYEAQEKILHELRQELKGSILMTTPDGRKKEIPLYQVVRAFQPNAFGFVDKVGFFLSKNWEFVSEDPRESNTEGGVFPAIFGTVLMVILMSLFATPLGVLAAFYLREYAKQGTFVSIVRIAVNNLAGVPSIVFGVFGVGFFIYFIGGTIDKFFYPESLPTPTFGTGGILWASLTLALLTVPVVIVATEEGLAAVPRSIREASLALGATKFETVWRVIIPSVMPSILTGLILAMARAAGEVAPLMITGVVKLAPSLPIDSFAPFLHLERKFMHLGFHIYDVGFQSPNVDAAQPMVYTTTLLLILMVLLLNLTAIGLRNRLRKKLAVSAL